MKTPKQIWKSYANVVKAATYISRKIITTNFVKIAINQEPDHAIPAISHFIVMIKMIKNAAVANWYYKKK